MTRAAAAALDVEVAAGAMLDAVAPTLDVADGTPDVKGAALPLEAPGKAGEPEDAVPLAGVVLFGLSTLSNYAVSKTSNSYI